MKPAFLAPLCALGALVACTRGHAQEPKRPPDSSVDIYAAAPACTSTCTGCNCFHWALGCFPRCGCPDDYTANPYPRQCWPPYPPFYKCVPAGDCGPAGGCTVGKDKLTWWFIPTPRAFRAALWCEP
jgi:hypothetical protein